MITVELKTGEKLIGEIVEPHQTAPDFLRNLNSGIFIKRQFHITYVSNEQIANIRESYVGERETEPKH